MHDVRHHCKICQ